MHNQYWRGSEKNLFGVSFENDGKFVIKKRENLQSTNTCNNDPAEVKYAAPWELVNYTEDLSQLYLTSGEPIKYIHEQTENESKFRRWLEVKTVPYDLANDEGKDKLKLSVTAVVEWEEGSKVNEFRLPNILTDWKSGPL
jgi:hypothetical protein